MSATTRYYVERNWPIATAAILSLAFGWSYTSISNPDDFIKELVGSALVVCGTLLGFLLTITTILNAITSRRMDFLKSHVGGYETLLSYMRLAIWLNIITVTVAIAAPAFNAYVVWNIAHQVAHAFVVFIICWTWCASIRFTAIFVRILSDH